MAVAPQDVYRIIADPARSADEKRAAIDMLYGPAPAAAPDMRLAENSVPSDSVMFGSGALNTPSAVASPVASDAGGMSVAPAPAASVSQSAPAAAAPVASSGGMS